jgi:hypothetical protein
MGIAMDSKLIHHQMEGNQKAFNQAEWEQSIRDMMIKVGWTCDIDDETKLGFIIKDKEGQRFCRDYDKRTHSFIQLAMDQKITLKSTKETNDL